MKNIIITNLVWKFSERVLTQGLQFVVQIVIARLLFPSEYGLISFVQIFITIASVFVSSGFGKALVQKKEINSADYSSIFYISITIAILCYFVLFISAPLVSDFIGISELATILRVLSLTLFPNAINTIQVAIIAREMTFKRLFYSSIGASSISGIVGITLAFLGFGVWALVMQQLLSQVCITIILWFTVKWRPTLEFSDECAKSLFSFGWKLLVSSLIDTVYRNIRSIIIGKQYSSSMLGYYARGQQFPQIIISNINGSIQAVMFPALATHQDYIPRVKSMMRRAIVTSSFVIFPIMVGLVIISEPLVIILLTEKWLPAVPFLRIFCISYALWPIHTANLQAINAMGRSDIYLKLEICKKLVGLVILGFSLSFGVYWLAIGEIFSGLFSSFVNAYPNRKLLDYGYLEQIKDILPSIGISLLMGIGIYPIKYLYFSSFVTVLLQVSIGIGLYIVLAIVFKFECLTFLVKTFYSFNNEGPK